jgi:hypothetical protein
MFTLVVTTKTAILNMLQIITAQFTVMTLINLFMLGIVDDTLEVAEVVPMVQVVMQPLKQAQHMLVAMEELVAEHTVFVVVTAAEVKEHKETAQQVDFQEGQEQSLEVEALCLAQELLAE